MLFSSLYYLFATLIWLIFIPFLLYKSKEKKYKESIPARFFLKNNPPFEKELIHFHSCSLGEVRAIKPIVERLNLDINLSTTTNTGFSEATKITKNVRFLPYEIFLPFWYKKQKLLVVLEAELWYMLFLIAKKKGVKTILLNARISDKSYKSYKRLSFFYKRIFQNIDLVLAQSQKDCDRLKTLGAKEVRVVGNIKVFQNIKVTKEYQKPKKPLLTIASSHEDEELLLLKSIKDLQNYHIAIVPRHPERFSKVAKELKENGYDFKLFSNEKNFNFPITLVDAMGELINIYAISEIVLLGGSFVDNVGGHNPLEPAYFGCKIISGKYFFNQKALYEVVQNIVVCDDVSKLEECIKSAKAAYYDKNFDINKVVKTIASLYQ